MPKKETVKKSEIKKLFILGDIHIRNAKRIDEYQEMLTCLINSIKEESKGYGKEEIRIVVCGDIFDNKIDISEEAHIICNWLISKLQEMFKTIIIAGNHDCNVNNLNRTDPLSAMFQLCEYKNAHYLDAELGYESGCLEDGNIVWCLYSIFSGFNRPGNLEALRIEHPDKVFVGLCHGEVKGCTTNAGYISDNGLSISYFDGLDVCLCGHIHKRQVLNGNDCKIYYTGSVIQQNQGESVSDHGYLIYDIENDEMESRDIPNDNYGFYSFEINDIKDLSEDKEEYINP